MATKPVYIAVIGVGGVGTAFLHQLGHLAKTYPSIHPVFISRSKTCLFVSDFHQKLSLATWQADLAASKQPVLSSQELIAYLGTARGPAVVVDNTSSQDVADAYPAFLRAGISVVTPNKKAFSGSAELWADVQAAARPAANPGAGSLFHEATVGAGLPIISTLKELVETGDTVVKIEGVFSGTFSFLFNSFSPVTGGGGKWSAEVKAAQRLGYTEPDPRDDLNGMDVARKVVILARLAGMEVAGTSACNPHSLVPKALENVNTAEFLNRLEEFDGGMEVVREKAEREGKVLRYVGSVDVPGKSLAVGLEMFDKGQPVAGLRGSDNIISFYTKRYGDRPLIVQGAGAGGEVTAMGVSGDLIKCLQRFQ